MLNEQRMKQKRLLYAGILRDVVFPAAKGGKKVYKEEFEARDYTPVEMMKSFTFWRAFIYLTFVLAVGNSVISFARDLVLSVGAAPAFYGQKHFAVNFSIITANLIPVSFIAAFSNNLFINTGSYTTPFVLLLVLAAGSLGLNLSIRRP